MSFILLCNGCNTGVSSILVHNEASSAVRRKIFQLARKEYYFSESSVRVILRCQSAGARHAG